MDKSIASKHLGSPQRLRISARDRILFVKRLSLYLRTGIPILEALSLISLEPGSSNSAKLLHFVIRDVRRGVSLSRALIIFPRVYSTMHVQLIAIGEHSGTLARSLAILERMFEHRARRRRTIVEMLAYPSILFVGSLFMSGFLLIYAFPKIVPLFRGLHAQLPLTTRLLISISSFVGLHWTLLVVGCAVCGVVIALLLRIPRVISWRGWCAIHAPFLGTLFRTHILAFIFRSIATLLASGVRLDESLRMARDGISNHQYRGALKAMRDSVLSGHKLSEAMGNHSGLFPAVSIQLISAGESTGTLSASSDSLAQIFEEDFTTRLKSFTTLLEPLIMLMMGLFIGFIALAIISPMYGITQNLSS